MVKKQEEVEASGTEDNFLAMLRELRAPVDPQMIRQRDGWRDRDGNAHQLDYVEWHTVADILDDVAPRWSHAIKDIRQFGEFLVATVVLTIDGVSREGMGTGHFANEMGIKKAEHDALKRAAVKFGIARELYRKEPEDQSAPQSRQQFSGNSAPRGNSYSGPANPTSGGMTKATSKQIGMITKVAGEKNVAADDIAHDVAGRSVDQLTKGEASDVIQALLNYNPERSYGGEVGGYGGQDFTGASDATQSASMNEPMPPRNAAADDDIPF